MDDEDLLRQLARTARDSEAQERERLDDRWDDLAAGKLSSEEMERLRTLDPEAYDLFRPVDSDFRKGVVDQIVPDGATALPFRPKPEPTSARRSRPRRWAPWLAAAAALILAVGLALTLDSRPEELVAYDAALSGGVETLRGPSASEPSGGGAVQRFVPGNSLRWILTPASAAGEVEVRLFLVHEGEVRSWDAPIEVAPTGAVAVTGTLGEELRLPAGQSTLAAIVARSGSLPAEATLLRQVTEQLPLTASPAGCAALSPQRWRCLAPLFFDSAPGGSSPEALETRTTGPPGREG